MSDTAQAVIDLVARDARFRPVMGRVLTTMRMVQTKMEAVARTARRVLMIGSGMAIGVIAVFGIFEKRMARVQALTQATEAEFAALSAEARRLGKETTFSASQAAQAMAAFAQQGFKTHEILQSMGATLSLAAAGMLEMGQAASITAGIMRSMKIPAEELTRVADVLAFAFTNSATDMVQLGEAMKAVGPVASKAGFSLEETVAAIRAFSDVMIQGSAAGMALRNILLRLSAQPSEVKKALNRLGVTIADTSGKMKPLATIIDEVASRMQNMSEIQQSATTSQLAGMRAAAAFTELLTLGGDTIRRYTAEHEKAGGTVGRIARTQMNNIIDKFKLLKSAVEEATLKIGDRFIPHVEALRDSVNSAADAFNGLSPRAIGIGVIFAETAIVTAAMVLAMKAAISVSLGLAGSLHAASAAAAICSASVTKLGLALGTFTIAARLASTAVAVGLVAGMGALTMGVVAAVLAIGQTNAALKRLTESSKVSAESLKNLARARKELARSQPHERVSALTSLLQALGAEKEDIERQVKEIRDLRKGVVGFLAGATARGALDDQERALRGRLAKLTMEIRRAEGNLERAKAWTAQPASEDPEAAGRFRRAQIGETIAALVRLEDEEQLVAMMESLRLKGIEDLTAAEQEALKSAIGYADALKRQAQAAADAENTIKTLQDEIRVMIGTATEAQIAMEQAMAAGADPAMARHMRHLLELRKALVEGKRERTSERTEADAIRRSIRTKQQQLQVDLERIAALRAIGELTEEEASKAATLARERAKGAEQERNLMGAREGMSQMFARIAEAAARPTTQTSETQIAVDTKRIAAAAEEAKRKRIEANTLLGRIAAGVEQLMRERDMVLG